MAWGGNHLELTKEEYIKQIQQMTGMRVKSMFRKLNTKEIKQIREMIESARLIAIDEYKKGVAELE